MLKGKFQFVLAVACLSGACAERYPRLPEVSGADRTEALQGVAIAPDLSPTTGTIAANERLTRQTIDRIQAAALPTRPQRPSNPKDHGTWTGRGNDAACGSSWSMHLEVSERDVWGKLQWSEIDYDLVGRLDENGQMIGAFAAKSRAFANAIGPRFFEINLTFQAREADGAYAIKKFNKLSCSTKVTLNKL